MAGTDSPGASGRTAQFRRTRTASESDPARVAECHKGSRFFDLEFCGCGRATWKIPAEASRLWPRGEALFSLRSEDPARHRRRTEQLFLPALPASATASARQPTEIEGAG